MKYEMFFFYRTPKVSLQFEPVGRVLIHLIGIKLETIAADLFCAIHRVVRISQ